MEEYNYMNQDVWCGNENIRQNPYTNDSYDYECYNNYPYDECGYDYSCANDGYVNQCSYDDPFNESYDNGYYVSYNNDCGWTDDSSQNHCYESPYSSEMQESLDESFESNKWEQMLDMQEDNSKRLLNIQKKLDELLEQLNQPSPPENLSDTTQVDEVSFLCHDDFFDNKVHEPTPSEIEIVVEDYVSLDDRDNERFLEVKEVVTDLENCNGNSHELETPKVGEGFVEANTTPDPMILKEYENQSLVLMETKIPMCFKQPNVIIDCPLLSTIYIQNSCRDCTIDEIFGNKKERLLLFEITDVPPMSGDLIVINTIDDNVHEHTSNMLTDTSRTLESCLSCFRSKVLECRIMRRKLWRKKHDASHAHKSKMKVFYGIKSRIKHSHGRHKARRLGFYKVNESITFDPGGSQCIYDPP